MEPMNPLAHRIKVKIGTAEFDAEGAPELVKLQFADFMAAVSQMPASSTPKPPEISEGATKDPKTVANNEGRTDVPKTILSRVFRSGDPLSLMAIPKTDNADADAILMLIYGHTELAGLPEVTGTALMKSASKTGLQFDRLSRAIAVRGELVRITGVKKGSRYSLNNRGIAEAERLIKSMVE